MILQGSCQTEIRRIGWGPVISISKRCKQSLACENNFIQVGFSFLFYKKIRLMTYH